MSDFVKRTKAVKKLSNATAEFSYHMLVRLVQKVDEGFSGWDTAKDDPEIYQNIVERLHQKAEAVKKSITANDKDLIDIANFAMMIYNANHPEGML